MRYLSTNRDCIKEIQISNTEGKHLSHFNGYFSLFNCILGSLKALGVI